MEAGKRSLADNVANDPSPRAIPVMSDACVRWSESLDRWVFATSRTFVRQSEADMDYGGEQSKCENKVEKASTCFEEYVYAQGKQCSDPQPCGKPSSVSIDDYKDGFWVASHCLMRPNAGIKPSHEAGSA